MRSISVFCVFKTKLPDGKGGKTEIDFFLTVRKFNCLTFELFRFYPPILQTHRDLLAPFNSSWAPFDFYFLCIHILGVFLPSVSSGCLLSALIHVVAPVFNHKHFLWSIPGHLPLLPPCWPRGLRIAPTALLGLEHSWPVCVSENSLWLFSNNVILAAIASFWGICIYGIHRHGFHAAVPGIPNAWDSFCTENPDLNISEEVVASLWTQLW